MPALSKHEKFLKKYEKSYAENYFCYLTGAEIVILIQNYIPICYTWRRGNERCQFIKSYEKRCSGYLCLFFLQPNYILVKRDTGHGKGWVEVSVDMKVKVKVTGIIYRQNTWLECVDQLFPSESWSYMKELISPLLHWMRFIFQGFGGRKASGVVSLRRGQGSPHASKFLISFDLYSYLFPIRGVRKKVSQRRRERNEFF